MVTIVYYLSGTPGVGKSSLCTEVVKQINFEWIEISKVAKTRDCLSGFDNELNCPVIDEDRVSYSYFCVIIDHSVSIITSVKFISKQVIDELDPVVETGGKIVEYHSCDFFPERWFDQVFVVRADNTALYDRLQARYYIYHRTECIHTL